MVNCIIECFGSGILGIFLGMTFALNANRALNDILDNKSISTLYIFSDILNLILAISILLGGTFLFAKSILYNPNKFNVNSDES